MPQLCRMQERAAAGLTLIETFWNFFRWQKWGKKSEKGQKWVSVQPEPSGQNLTN